MAWLSEPPARDQPGIALETTREPAGRPVESRLFPAPPALLLPPPPPPSPTVVIDRIEIVTGTRTAARADPLASLADRRRGASRHAGRR